MASFGLILPGGASGISVDARGRSSSQVVLVTTAGDPSGGIATVTTDRQDYSPGDTVTITGAGWDPGETVTLAFREDSAIDVHESLSATADADGHILNRQFSPDSLDLGVRFVVTATGQTSGRTAQTTFTDAATITIATATVNGGATTNVVVGQSITAVLTTGSPTSDSWNSTEFATTPATTTPCFDHANHATAPATETLTLTAPSTVGTFSALFTPYKNDACNGGGNAGTTKTLTNAIVVSKGNTSTTLTSSANPSVFGQSITLTATVAAASPATGSPNGTNSVTFKDGAATLGTGTITCAATCTATLATATLTVSGSPHSLTAVYAGNASFNGSTSAPLAQTVNTANTTTALSSSVNPSTFGQAITFTATVTPIAPGAGTRTGTVQFQIDGSNFGSPVSINASGVATSGSISTLTAVSHPVAAVYGGDANFSGSTSTVIAAQTVNKAATTTSITSDTPDPSTSGQAVVVNFAVAVTAPGAGTPTGNVTVTVSGGAETCTGTVAAGTCSITLTALGARTLTATYAGDANFNTQRLCRHGASGQRLGHHDGSGVIGQPVDLRAVGHLHRHRHQQLHSGDRGQRDLHRGRHLRSPDHHAPSGNRAQRQRPGHLRDQRALRWVAHHHRLLRRERQLRREQR